MLKPEPVYLIPQVEQLWTNLLRRSVSWDSSPMAPAASYF
jgi:hypothetical protein